MRLQNLPSSSTKSTMTNSLFDLILRVGLSTGRSGSGLCPTRNQPDHFGSPKPRPAGGNGSGGWTLSFSSWFLVRLGLCKSSSDFAKICLFLLDWSDFEEILADLNEMRPNLEEISTRSSSISKRSGEISTRSRWISKRSSKISKRQRPRTLNQTKIPSIRLATIHNLVDFSPLLLKVLGL